MYTYIHIIYIYIYKYIKYVYIYVYILYIYINISNIYIYIHIYIYILYISKTQFFIQGDFLNKIKNINAIPETIILVTADVVGFYQSIPHQAGLEVLREALDKGKTHKVPTYQ